MSTKFLLLAEQAALRAPEFRGTPRHACVAAARDFHRATWNEAFHAHSGGASGGNVVRMLSDAADAVVRGVAAFTLHTIGDAESFMDHAALCALGGYGRRELSPYSDLDLCLLYDELPDDALDSFTHYFSTFLWDMGFKPGFVTHSIDEARALAESDPEVFTAYAQARQILGEGNVLARLDVALDAVRRDKPEFVLRHLSKRLRPAELPGPYRDLYCAEPDIKENAGGLRDGHAAYWMFLVKYGRVTLEDLVRLNALDEEEHLAAMEGRDFLWRIRNELHFSNSGPGNLLTHDKQPGVAKAFGYGDGNLESVGRFMQDYYAAAGQMRGFLRNAARACHRAMEPDREVQPATGRAAIAVRGDEIWIDVTDPWWFAEKPARLMELFWRCARLGKPLSPAAERWVRENLYLVNDTFTASDTVRGYFLAICGDPLRAGFALRQAAHAGLLAAYLPEWAAIQGILRYEDFHSFPVDEHTLRALEALAYLDTLEGGVARVLQETLEHVRDPRILVLAILCHDLGKAQGEIHADASVQCAYAIASRLQLTVEDTDRIVFLVQHHMLMSNIALYRNTDDPEVVRTFADTMTSTERLRELLLHTYADLSAVAPGVWTDWKGALLLKLFLRAERYLLGRGQSNDEEYWKHPKGDAVRKHLPPALAAQVEDYLRGIGEQYFLSFPPERIAQHIECLDEARRTGLAMRWVNIPQTDLSEVVVCTRDKRRLFAEIAGSFTAQLADVNAAALFTTPDGWVVDCFVATDVAHGRPLTEDQLQGVSEVLHGVLLDGNDIRTYVEQSRQRLFALARPRVSAPTRISFDNDASRGDTVIDIETADRTGLLFDIGSALANAGVDVYTARIVTDACRVRDAFYVRKGDAKITDPETQETLRNGLAEAIRGMIPAPATGEA